MRELAYSFRGSVHYHHGREHGTMQAEVVLELRVLHLAGIRKSADSLRGILSRRNLRARPHSDALPPKPYFNKVTPLNSATPCGIKGVNYVQTITVRKFFFYDFVEDIF